MVKIAVDFENGHVIFHHPPLHNEISIFELILEGKNEGIRMVCPSSSHFHSKDCEQWVAARDETKWSRLNHTNEANRLTTVSLVLIFGRKWYNLGPLIHHLHGRLCLVKDVV
jgi:hypothetical protein